MLTTSVIMPTYNRAELLVRAIHSVLPQLGEGDEILVMDDGSSDDTAESVKPLGPRVRYFRLENGGPSRARNVGLQHATGDLIAFLDDDDEWFPFKLMLQRATMVAYPEVVLSFTNFTVQFRDGRRAPHALLSWGQRERRWDRIFESAVPFSSFAPLPAGLPDFTVYCGPIYERQMFDDYVLPSTQMVRRTPATMPVRFPEDLRFCESWAYSSAVAALGPAAFLDVDAIIQHDHVGPRLTGVDILKQTSSRLAVLERQWGKDEAFLARHSMALHARMDEERLLRAREFVASSQPALAQQELAQMKGGAPALLRVLSLLPADLVHLMNFTRALLRGHR